MEGLSAWRQARLTDVKPCLCASFASCPVLRSPLLLRWQFSLLQLQMSLQVSVRVRVQIKAAGLCLSRLHRGVQRRQLQSHVSLSVLSRMPAAAATVLAPAGSRGTQQAASWGQRCQL